MTDIIQQLDDNFKHDADYRALGREQKIHIITVLEKMMDMGMAAVYGDETADEPDAEVPCSSLVHQCKAICCSFIFALTKDEVKKGLFAYNKQRPFFIARDADGYCPQLDRHRLICKVWDERPLRCRRYDCRCDREIWPDDPPGITGQQQCAGKK